MKVKKGAVSFTQLEEAIDNEAEEYLPSYAICSSACNFKHSRACSNDFSSIDCVTRSNETASLKVKRLRANDRERKRVNLINSAMENLRKVVPFLRERRKITKLELLRCAHRYIWLLNLSLQTGMPVEELEQIQYYHPSVVNNAQPSMQFAQSFIRPGQLYDPATI
eukprot:gene17450-19195_t